ncbi:MAG: DedA family protein [Candidatus Sumerlaeota bacterium]|nr:DedA family protein [Candidatus Sumerlaeota bacterium]
METLRHAVEFLLHLDKSLAQIIANYGAWTYLIVFVVVFCETGLVVTPFLPGDSLLFAVGVFAAKGSLHLGSAWVLLTAAAILGDAANYSIGHFLGPELHDRGRLPFIKQEYLDRTHRFYEKYGKMTIILARFVPIVRTFAPFLAGVGTMRYAEFALYNMTGAVLWVTLLVFAGCFFGTLPFVERNFSMVIMAIIVISILPLVIEYLRHRNDASETAPDAAGK